MRGLNNIWRLKNEGWPDRVFADFSVVRKTEIIFCQQAINCILIIIAKLRTIGHI
jgi:hypothetical protein